jgi:hypothetical protein
MSRKLEILDAVCISAIVSNKTHVDSCDDGIDSSKTDMKPEGVRQGSGVQQLRVVESSKGAPL